MPKELDAYVKATKDWERAMRNCRIYEDKIEAMNDKIAKGVPPREMDKYVALIKKLSKDLMGAGKKEESMHKKMTKALEALS